MHSTSIFRLAIGISLWLFITTISNAAPTDNTEKITDLQRDVAVLKDTTTLRLEAQKDALQKDLQNLQSKIDQQDKRIGDISAETGRFSIIAGALSALITLLVLVAGYFSWTNAGQKAKEATQEGIEKYAKELTKSTDAGIAEVNLRAKLALNEIELRVSEASASLMRVEAMEKQAEDHLQKSLTSGSPTSLTTQEIQALNSKDKRLQEIPESQYTFADWNSRAFAAVATANFEEAAHFFLQASSVPDALPWQVVGSLLNRGFALVKLKRFEGSIEAYDRAIAMLGEPSTLALQEQLATALVNKGVALSGLGRTDSAIAVYDQLIARFANSEELALRAPVAVGIGNKGIALTKLGRNETASSVFDLLIERFSGAAELALREQVTKALVNKGIVLSQLKRHDDAIAAFEQVISHKGTEHWSREQVAKAMSAMGNELRALNRYQDALEVYEQVISQFGAATKIELLEPVAIAMVNKGLALVELKRHEDALRTYDQVIACFGNAVEVSLLEAAASAMLNKSALLIQLDRQEDAIIICNLAIERFGDASELALLEPAAKAMVNKAASLRMLERQEDAVELLNDVVKRFGIADAPLLRQRVGDAYNLLGFSLLMQAKRTWQEAGKRYNLLAEACAKFRDAILRSPTPSTELGNLAYALFLLQREDEAKEPLHRALVLGKEKLYVDTITDIETDSVPPDTAFRALLDKTWDEIQSIKQ